jgi:hypothetical protein
MKARIIFYCVVIAILLATLATIPSHGIERRDPLLNQETAQVPGSGHTDSSAKAATAHKKPSPAHQAHAPGMKDKPAKGRSSADNQTSK